MSENNEDSSIDYGRVRAMQGSYDVAFNHKRNGRCSWVGFSKDSDESVDEPIEVHFYEGYDLMKTVTLTEAELRMIARWSQYR